MRLLLAAAALLLAVAVLLASRRRTTVIVATRYPYPPEDDDGIQPEDPRTWIVTRDSSMTYPPAGCTCGTWRATTLSHPQRDVDRGVSPPPTRICR